MGYFFKYFLARAAYDTLRAGIRDRSHKWSRRDKKRILSHPDFEAECKRQGLDPDTVRWFLKH